MNLVMNIIVGLIFVASGVLFAFRPRALWWLRRGWLKNRAPTDTELLLCRILGGLTAVMGLALALLNV